MNTTFLLSVRNSEDAFGIIALLVVAAIFFFFIRGVLLWYWKVNDIVKNQEETNQLLRSIVRNMESKDDYKSNDNL